MAWKKSKSHHARKAQATEIMQENHFACYFTHTVYMSECQTQMSWVINHWFIKDLACLHTTMKWHIMTCDRFGLLKNTDKKKKQNRTKKQYWNRIMKFFILIFYDFDSLDICSNFDGNKGKSMEGLWSLEGYLVKKTALSQVILIIFIFPPLIFLNKPLNFKMFWDLMESLVRFTKV